MAITKETIIEKIEVVHLWNIQIAVDTVIKEGNTEIARSRHRNTLQPYISSNKEGKWTHTATDISKEDVSVRAIANAAWTDDVKSKYKECLEAQEI